MMLAFFYLMNVVLLTRALWIFSDEKVRLKVLISGIIIQVAALSALKLDLYLVFLFAGIVFVANLITWFFEYRVSGQGARLGGRLVSLACWFVGFGFFCSDLFTVDFNSWTLRLFEMAGSLSDTFHLIEQNHLIIVSACCAGAFLAVVEAHTALRFLFNILNVKPTETRDCGEDNPSNADRIEYNRGRIIGVLERILVFFFVLQGAYGALGFLIAAKGMTRFKQLDNRDFAEYFLIGTLLSIIFSGCSALVIKHLLIALV